MYYNTNSITLGGGESLDVILDHAPGRHSDTGTYYLYTPNLDHLSNDAENFGGLMTEVHVTIRGAAMSALSIKKVTSMKRLLPGSLMAAAACSCRSSAHAAAPGITGNGSIATFNLTAQPAYITQPDGQMVYSWGYGCATAPPADLCARRRSAGAHCAPPCRSRARR